MICQHAFGEFAEKVVSSIFFCSCVLKNTLAYYTIGAFEWLFQGIASFLSYETTSSDCPKTRIGFNPYVPL